jgi:hypothetical protein
MDPSSGSDADSTSKMELKIKNEVVGAWRFELQTSCAQGKSRNAKWLVRLAFSYVMHYGFARYSEVFVPKLFPSFGMNPCSETNSLGTLAVV